MAISYNSDGSISPFPLPLRRQNVADGEVFRTLDESGRFHRDTRVGRLFHPGKVTFREIRPTDSVHITLADDNRFSVHVDRVSPLSTGSGRSRYSLSRAVGHNFVHAGEAFARCLRRSGGKQRCHLDCGVVTQHTEAEETVYEYSCRAAGAEGCRWKTRTTSEDELIVQVTEHVRAVHGVKSMGDTLARYAIEVATKR